MNKKFASCFLRSLSSNIPDIALPHQEEILLGRGPMTKIADPRFDYQQTNTPIWGKINLLFSADLWFTHYQIDNIIISSKTS